MKDYKIGSVYVRVGKWPKDLVRSMIIIQIMSNFVQLEPKLNPKTGLNHHHHTTHHILF